MSALEILVSRLPGGTVRTDAETLRERAQDSWALSLLRRVRGPGLALILPGHADSRNVHGDHLPTRWPPV